MEVTFPHGTAVDPPSPVHSPFLQLPATVWIARNELAFAIPALLPVGPRHTLIVPRRQITSYFDATRDEKTALWALVDEVERALDGQLRCNIKRTPASARNGR